MDEKNKSEKNLRYEEIPEVAREKLSSHIGFSREKKRFYDYVYLYSATHGNFFPKRDIICYSGPPGIGKTTFVKSLADSMSRPLLIVSCAGLDDFSDFSILGRNEKKSIAEWAIEETLCLNPIILFDELEKIKDNGTIQKDLIKLFRLYKDEKNKGLKLNGISLEHFSFFSTVNYINNLVPLLKNEIEVREMGGLTDTEKEEILKIKRAEINSRFGFDNEEEIITNRFLKTLIQYVKESGIRRKEKVLRRIEKDYIVNEKVDKELVENPMFWLRENVAIYKEDFSFKKKHFLLIFVLLLNWIAFFFALAKRLELKDIEEKWKK